MLVTFRCALGVPTSRIGVLRGPGIKEGVEGDTDAFYVVRSARVSGRRTVRWLLFPFWIAAVAVTRFARYHATLTKSKRSYIFTANLQCSTVCKRGTCVFLFIYSVGKPWALLLADLSLSA